MARIAATTLPFTSNRWLPTTDQSLDFSLALTERAYAGVFDKPVWSRPSSASAWRSQCRSAADEIPRSAASAGTDLSHAPREADSLRPELRRVGSRGARQRDTPRFSDRIFTCPQKCGNSTSHRLQSAGQGAAVRCLLKAGCPSPVPASDRSVPFPRGSCSCPFRCAKADRRPIPARSRIGLFNGRSPLSTVGKACFYYAALKFGGGCLPPSTAGSETAPTAWLL